MTRKQEREHKAGNQIRKALIARMPWHFSLASRKGIQDGKFTERAKTFAARVESGLSE